jgi:hypothetical protein
VVKRLNKKAFFEDLGYQPHAGQWEVHRSKAMRRILACGARWGKSMLAAAEGLSAAMEPCDRSIGWIVAPTYDLCDRVYREIVIQAAEHLRHRIVSLKEGEKRLILRNMGGGLSEVKGKSSDNPISLLGEGLDWVIVDEAAQLKPKIWEGYLSQRLIDRQGWALLISTPRGKGYFFDLFRRGQGQDADYQSWNYPSWTNPYLNRELIEKERDRLPERVFNQEFGGQFIEGAGQVFRNVRECATGQWQEPVRRKFYYAGLDLAKTEDFSVVVIMNWDREVVFVDRFHRLDWALQVNRIKAAVDKYNHATIYCDSTGAGEPIFENLRRNNIYARPYSFTNRSKAALIDKLSLMLEQELITLPRADLWPEGIDELESFQYSVTDSGNVKSGAPHGVHDDCVIALALACWSLPGTMVDVDRFLSDIEPIYPQGEEE